MTLVYVNSKGQLCDENDPDVAMQLDDTDARVKDQVKKPAKAEEAPEPPKAKAK